MRNFINLIFVVLIFSTTAYTKDLTGRFGAGFTSRQLSTTPAVSFKYAFSNNHALEVALGVETGGSNNSKLAIGGRFYRNAYQQENINFFLGLGTFILREETESSLTSGFEVSGIFGAEFFFERIEPLGFTILCGIGLESLTSGVRFSTAGQSFLTAGIHYYF